MKWFVATIVFVIIFTLLFSINRGLFVGSEIRKDSPRGTTHYRYCKYLTITGVVEARAEWWGESREEALRRTSCPILRERN